MVESITNSQAEVLQGLSKFMTITEISKWRKVSRQAIYKVTRRLLARGMIEKIGLAWRLTDKGRGGLHSFIGFTYKKRYHNLAFKIAIKENPRNWDKKRNTLMLLPYFNKRVELKNNSFDLFNFGKIQVKTTTRSVILKLPTIYSDTVEEAILEGMDMLFTSIPRIEASFKIKLVKDNRANITIISQEWARLQDPLAKLYEEKDEKLYIKDENGDVRLIIDYSFAVGELEAIHPNKSPEDMKAVDTFMLDLVKNPLTMSELKGVVQGVASNQVMFAQNIETHMRVLKGMEQALSDVGEAVTQLKDEVKKLGK
ncbi:hypothetical protein LCGC14_2434360 [marine sediment metagenome]|uniref:Uncharacterized protein n=1 Tax=marine sediment metagenome TaxID=412755 RepID=A0A0F9C8A7_9ZZZZ